MTRVGDKSIVNQSQVIGASVAADFQKTEFDILFRDKGYDVIHQQAIMCSCKAKQGDHLSDCQNCGGSGWIHVNPTRTRMIITGMDLTKDYDEAARTDIGLSYITARHEDKLSFMDSIMIENALAVHHEVLFPTIDANFVRASTIYNIEAVEFIGKYVGQTKILTKLVEGTDYTFSNNVIDFTTAFHEVTSAATNGMPSGIILEDSAGGLLTLGIQRDDIIANTTDGSSCKVLSVIDDTTITTSPLTGGTSNLFTSADAYTITLSPKVSIRYRHHPLLYIWDSPREMLSSLLVKGAERRDNVNLAVKAIGKRAHLIVGAENWAGNRLLDNSWMPECAPSEPSKVVQIIRNVTAQYIWDNMTPSQQVDMTAITP
jgi:hypothetical protein